MVILNSLQFMTFLASQSSKLPKSSKASSELYETLDNYDVIINHGEKFKCINDRETNIVIFTCLHNFEILRKMKTVFVDENFKSCLKLFYQLLTILGLKYNNYFPLVFFLLAIKNSTTYTQSFQFMENQMKHEIIFAYFEKAIHLALSEVWRQCKLKGCIFNMYISRTLDEFKNKDSEIGQILTYFIGLPILLPGNWVAHQFIVNQFMARQFIARNS